jgi:hypothetical protein
MSTDFLDVRFGILAASDQSLSYGFRHVVLLFLVGAHVLPQNFRHASLQFRSFTRCALSVGGLNQSTQHVILNQRCCVVWVTSSSRNFIAAEKTELCDRWIPPGRHRLRLVLTLAEPEQIKQSPSIARLLGNSPSTVSRKMYRDGDRDC